MSDVGKPVEPVAAPVTPAPAAATPDVAPVSAPDAVAPVVSPSPEAPAVESTPKAETVIGEAMKPVEPVKAPEGEKTPESAEAPKAEGEQKATEGQSDEPAPLPSYEPFTLPENVKLDDKRVGDFTNILGEFERTTKADHAEVQQFGQKAVDFHVAEVTKAVEGVEKTYQTLWEKQKTDWKDQLMKDPEIGGNRFQTTVDSALKFIRTHGGNEEQQASFRTLMDSSGLGNHPAMVRLLANAGMAMSEGKPLAAKSPAPSVAKSKVETMYGKRPS